MVQGDRSLELVQAILVMIEWYGSSDDLRHLTFYTWVQMADVMVRELGLCPLERGGCGRAAHRYCGRIKDDVCCLSNHGNVGKFTVYLSSSLLLFCLLLNTTNGLLT